MTRTERTPAQASIRGVRTLSILKERGDGEGELSGVCDGDLEAVVEQHEFCPGLALEGRCGEDKQREVGVSCVEAPAPGGARQRDRGDDLGRWVEEEEIRGRCEGDAKRGAFVDVMVVLCIDTTGLFSLLGFP